MDFGGDIGLIQRKIAESQEGTSRRFSVFNALSIKSGQSVLDLGCGGGHLVREFALATGEKGRVVGLDASQEQLDSAAELCANLPGVELVTGDATNMAFGDDEFDCLASIQMYEYVEDVDAALTESARVLKPGGRAAMVSVLWDHWRFHGAEPELNNLMHETWRLHCPHQMLPMELPVKLESAGFHGVTQCPIAFINTNMHDNAFASWASRAVALFASAKGVEDEKVAAWLEQLKTADREGRFGFVSVPVLTTATAL